MYFGSDNAAAACPEVIEAVLAANTGVQGAYDGDTLTQRLDGVFSDFFGRECRVFVVGSGTAANCLGLAAMVPPWGAIVCSREAHIQVDEAGAPAFFSGGASLVLAEATAARLTVEGVRAAVAWMRGDVHQVQPAALSITQATEYGCVYTPGEVAALGDEAKRRGWRLHLDGARFANALVHLGCAPGDITWRAGVDVMSFGFIKNGGMSAEAIVVFDPALAQTLPHRKKRAGQMPSKGRYAAAQLLAMIETGAWARNARAANEAASRIGAAAGDRLLHPVQANEVFVRASPEDSAALRAKGFEFYDWAAGEIRLVTAWDTPEAHVQALAAALAVL
ncbi:threonine aldolase family protein [Sphingosinicella soli]|uniref:Threonine aldolase n=1 Tax=Sphingosinicella soli TaxID=333708 RepID=A0A7W7B4G9_9SPHN|nr:beta-eliminating lyase-related protein [Sphingosinicella soli]MBB4633826.1 threonine aldolase [Sphingosinicella soli]